MARVSATELQKNFGKWSEKAIKEPVAIERHGRKAFYLVSSDWFDAAKRSSRRAVAVEDMPDDMAALVRNAKWGK
jgi:PHD/YefM family antitoxin component YafN of YafNO toxin-antitoxin module